MDDIANTILSSHGLSNLVKKSDHRLSTERLKLSQSITALIVNMAFSTGDIVNLLHGDDIVGDGRVLNVDPEGLCHGTWLGKAKISVEIFSADSGVELPIPFGDIEFLSDAIGFIVMWRRDQICLATIPELSPVTSPGSSSEDDAVHKICPAPPSPDISVYRDRKTWHMLEAVLLHPTIPDLSLADGLITYNLPHFCVGGSILGDNKVGVLISKLHVLDDKQMMRACFLTYTAGHPLLVAWCLQDVLILALGKRLSKICSVDSEVDLDKECPAYIKPAKRLYNFSVRKRWNPEAERGRQYAKKCRRLITDDAVHNAKMCCCIDRCCDKAIRQNVTREREVYWSVSPGSQETMILEKFRSRNTGLIVDGKMVFASKMVCKKAFYQLYGFRKTLFFAYQKKYESGTTIGLHWGKEMAKPTQPIVQSISFMRHVLESTSEPLPHLPYTGSNGTNTYMFKLPSCYSKECIFRDVCSMMKGYNMRPMSLSSFHSAWQKHFGNFKLHKTSAFAKCSTCSNLKEQLSKERRSEARGDILCQRVSHLELAQSRRFEYYTNCINAQLYPDKFFSIIHDKMDQAKTGIPKLAEFNKDFSIGCAPMPFALTGMLTHGRHPGAFGHFSLNGLFPSDPNFTITSLAKCLRDLEDWKGDHSGDISIPSTENINKPLFSALLDEHAFTSGFLKPKNISVDHFRCVENSFIEPSQGTSFKPLPRHLLLQLDNFCKDNKNRAVFAFCSQLVARGVFETVQVSFLMVGHTHEDVDALFSKVALELHQKEVDTLHGLMAALWSCQESHPVPSFIKEVADYKAFSNLGLKAMVGQSTPILFLFSMYNNVPVFQYREHISGNWFSIVGKPLWDQDKVGKPLLPDGQPMVVSISRMLRKRPDILSYIERFIDWKVKAALDRTSEAYSMLSPLLEYWRRICDIVAGGFNSGTSIAKHGNGEKVGDGYAGSSQNLLYNFWPQTNHGIGYKSPVGASQESPAVNPLEAELAGDMLDADEIFVGDLNDRPCAPFVPISHIDKNSFVLIRPSDDFESRIPGSVWLARATGPIDVTCGSSHFGEFKVEWWRPFMSNMAQHGPLVDRYKNWKVPSRFWERDPEYPH